MKEFNYIITDPAGIHARPAGLLAKEAKKYASRICIAADGKSADVTRLMSIMAMGIKKGVQVAVSLEGDDEEIAAVELKKFFQENL